MDITLLVKGKVFISMGNYSRLLLNLDKTNIYKHYSWSECFEKEMHWGLEEPLLMDILQMEGRYQPNLVGFCKTYCVFDKASITSE